MSDQQWVGEGQPTTFEEEWDLADELHGRMTDKLQANRGKAHWRTPGVTMAYLFDRLREEIRELDDAIAEQQPSVAVWDEAGDVANFAAMIADLYEKGSFDG